MAKHSNIANDRWVVDGSSTEGLSDVDYGALSSEGLRREYYEQNGYVVRRGLVDEGACARAVRMFQEEVKPYRGHLYRQASANPERHSLDSAGSMMNSLLNPLSMNRRRFPGFRTSTDAVLSSDLLFGAIEELCAEPAVLVQSMYFEGNPATWPHQDSYYLDADTPGQLVGAWIALEDIDRRAGRFYVLPGSQRVNLGTNAGNLSIGTNHARYKSHVHDYVRAHSGEIRAPILRRGDVLFWSSRTVHGATKPLGTGYTRQSYTAHFIPASAGFMQYECIPLALHPVSVGGNLLCRPKDQDRRVNRWMLSLESMAPKIFPRLKKAVIAHRIRQRNASC